MKHIALFAAFVLAISCSQGCATKTYGRQAVLTDDEKGSMNCREMDLEIAKVNRFIEHVNKESEFSGRDVLAIFGDFGIGNSLEKSAALESANKRIEQLRAQRDAKQCSPVPA